MSISKLLQRLGRGFRTSRRPCRPVGTRSYRPRLESLETRDLLSSFTVVLATDSGGTTGQRVSATTGDLRYCIEQADAAHSATTDTISFSSRAFGTPQTITLNSGTGPLVLDDSHPVSILGPSGDTVTVSGGDAVEVLNIGGGTVSISHLAISHGNALSNPSTSNQGGGIFDNGALTLTSCTLDHDAAGPSAGGLFVNTGGSATLSNCTFNHDTAAQTSPVDGEGGAIFAAGTLKMTNCNLSNCFAEVNGGAIFFHPRRRRGYRQCQLRGPCYADHHQLHYRQ